ncbi:HNH endonuclease signature motif containing protein [uncultured Victivallis sp.]|jgi:hypothetical protein|uniref:HNH endonuclease n=1 Tax=uncultured Victivallis sp. TaxID=354118 RepID=UPI002592C39D|nr:HNH endonuclease signature motif containing protein [uncultured Victivallis sp.]
MTKPIDLQKWYKELIPRTQAITHRNTSITNAFANALYPIQIPSEDVIKEVFNALGQDWKAGRLHCVYCGSKATELDHLNPVVKAKTGTGYFAEVYNLVPCCGTCNQSKGAKNWRTWIDSTAKQSPVSRGCDVKILIDRLEKFEQRYPATRIPIKKLVPTTLLEEYEKDRLEIIQKMQQAQEKAERIKRIIAQAILAGEI